VLREKKLKLLEGTGVFGDVKKEQPKKEV